MKALVGNSWNPFSDPDSVSDSVPDSDSDSVSVSDPVSDPIRDHVGLLVVREGIAVLGRLKGSRFAPASPPLTRPARGDGGGASQGGFHEDICAFT